jgi:predicted RNA-binding protein YlqC (UPF0109 family)
MSEEEIEEYEEEESIGEVEEVEEEEAGFTIEQIDIMIRATETWDQLMKGLISIEEASKILGREARTTRALKKSVSVAEEKIEKKIVSEKTSRKKKSKKSSS